VQEFILRLRELDDYWFDADVDDLKVNDPTTRVLYDMVKNQAKNYKYSHHDEKVIEKKEDPKEPPNIPPDEGKNTRASKAQKPQGEEESHQMLDRQPFKHAQKPSSSNQTAKVSKGSKRISKKKAPRHRAPYL